MEGKWQLVGGPPPEPDNLGPHYEYRCQISIDMFTRKVLSEPME